MILSNLSRTKKKINVNKLEKHIYVEHLDKQKERATVHEENLTVRWRSACDGIIKSKNNYFW